MLSFRTTDPNTHHKNSKDSANGRNFCTRLHHLDTLGAMAKQNQPSKQPKDLQKAKMAGQDPYLALLDHRNTPSQGLDNSPAQRILSHRTRTLLPTKASLLQPKMEQAQQELKSNQQRQSAYYNRSARDLDTLKPGDCILEVF